MARLHPHHPRTGTAAIGGGARELLAGATIALLLLLGPIVLWARVGDGGVLGMAVVTVAATATWSAVLRWTLRRYVRRRLPTTERVAQAQTSWSPSSYRGHGRPGPASSRPRRIGATPHPCGARRCSAVYVSRFSRDVGCRASDRLTHGRVARRRTRP
jgi:hypothetical protein